MAARSCWALARAPLPLPLCRRGVTQLCRVLSAPWAAPVARLSSSPVPTSPEVPIIFVEGSGREVSVTARIGESLLQTAHRHGVDMEGACEASIACSTCHVMLDRDIYESLPEATEKEEDMLDQAPGLTLTCVPPCCVCE